MKTEPELGKERGVAAGRASSAADSKKKRLHRQATVTKTSEIGLRKGCPARGGPSAYPKAQFALVVGIGRTAARSQVLEALGSGARSSVRRQPR